MDVNLDTLKREILDHLSSLGLAVFQSSPGALEGFPLVIWDSQHHPDYQKFLDIARQIGTKLIIFATREFEAGDIEERTTGFSNLRRFESQSSVQFADPKEPDN